MLFTFFFIQILIIFCSAVNSTNNTMLLSHRKPAAQSHYDHYDIKSAQNGVDGSYYTYFSTGVNYDVWWYVDLLHKYIITHIIIDNRIKKWNKFELMCGKTLLDLKKCGYYDEDMYNSYSISIAFIGRYLQLSEMGYAIIMLNEIQVFGSRINSVMLLSRGKRAIQSHTEKSSTDAHSGIDGSLETYVYINFNFNVWWIVDLFNIYIIKHVFIVTKTFWWGGSQIGTHVSITCGTILSNLSECAVVPNEYRNSYTLPCACNGQYVELKDYKRLWFSEIEVFGSLIIHGKWSNWTSCDSICDAGERECIRTRTCLRPGSEFGEKDCIGETSEIFKCPIKAKWSAWSSCTDICKFGGVECIKERNCSSPALQYGRTSCKGHTVIKTKCPNSIIATVGKIFGIICLSIVLLVLIYVLWKYISDIVETRKYKREEEKMYQLVMGDVLATVNVDKHKEDWESN